MASSPTKQIIFAAVCHFCFSCISRFVLQIHRFSRVFLREPNVPSDNSLTLRLYETSVQRLNLEMVGEARQLDVIKRIARCFQQVLRFQYDVHAQHHYRLPWQRDLICCPLQDVLAQSSML